MKDNNSHSFYNRAVNVAEEYLGPAGERFLRRQIENHLNINPEELQPRNMPKLIDWSSIAFAMLTNDDEDREAFIKDLKSLERSSV